MIDTLAKRAASSRFALGGSSIRPPTGTFDQIERGYTLGLYTFTYVAVSGDPWVINFCDEASLTGTLVGITTTATLVLSVTTNCEDDIGGIGFRRIGSTFVVW